MNLIDVIHIDTRINISVLSPLLNEVFQIQFERTPKNFQTVANLLLNIIINILFYIVY